MHRLPKHEPIRVFEGFAGYGGATFGLRRAKINHKVIGFSEIDNDAIVLYHYNFPNITNLGDITKLDPTNRKRVRDATLLSIFQFFTFAARI